MKKLHFLIYALFCLGIGTTIKAQYTDLLNFNGTNGAYPRSSLTLSGNTLYGMTYAGGANSDGNIFSIQTNGSGYTDLLNFNGTNGRYPEGSLFLSGTTLYGMTSAGGANGDGVIFSIQIDGSGYTDLLNFNGTNGKLPYGSLILSGDTLYGMTPDGGANNDGVIFSIQTNGGGYTDLLDFNGTNGYEPTGSLTLSSTTLYGMTYAGGANSDGNIFSIQTNGSGYTDLLDFNITNGAAPYGSLILSGSTLFGMTPDGGANNDGVIFSIQTNGNGYTDLLNFNGTNGKEPEGSLFLSGTRLFGMTPAGGANNDGCIFSFNTNGNVYDDMFDFNATNGEHPYGSLILSDDSLYGMTCLGGANNSGVVFRLKNCTLKALTSIVGNVNCKGGNDGSASSVVNGGTTPYTYSWTGGAVTAAVTGLSAGTYIVIVTDSNSCVSSSSVTITQPSSIDGNLLCFATVDSNSVHNIIAWDTTGSNNECIDSVSLFFYNSNNQWQKIGEESYTVADTAKYFVDHFNNPNAVTVRYCVKAVDIYGDTSYFSNWQNTMYVSNSAGTFSWAGTGYLIEGNSMPVLTYYLVRNDTVIDSVSGSQNKITDVNYSPIATYWIKARLNEVTCNLSPIAMGHRPELKDNVTNASRSNIINRKPLGINSIGLDKGQINIYPDPNNGKFTLSISNINEKCNVEIYNVFGERVYYAAMPQTPKGAFPKGMPSQSVVDLRGEANGVYFYRVVSESGELVGDGKIIVEK